MAETSTIIALEEVAQLATNWFARHLAAPADTTAMQRSSRSGRRHSRKETIHDAVPRPSRRRAATR